VKITCDYFVFSNGHSRNLEESIRDTSQGNIPWCVNWNKVDGRLPTFRKEGLDREPNGISHVEDFYAIVHLDE